MTANESPREPRARKIVLAFGMPETTYRHPEIYALADDGTLWVTGIHIGRGPWEQLELPNIPPFEKSR